MCDGEKGQVPPPRQSDLFMLFKITSYRKPRMVRKNTGPLPPLIRTSLPNLLVQHINVRLVSMLSIFHAEVNSDREKIQQV